MFLGDNARSALAFNTLLRLPKAMRQGAQTLTDDGGYVLTNGSVIETDGSITASAPVLIPDGYEPYAPPPGYVGPPIFVQSPPAQVGPTVQNGFVYPPNFVGPIPPAVAPAPTPIVAPVPVYAAPAPTPAAAPAVPAYTYPGEVNDSAAGPDVTGADSQTQKAGLNPLLILGMLSVFFGSK